MGVKISEKVVHLGRERHNYSTVQLVKLKRSFVEYPCPVGDEGAHHTNLNNSVKFLGKKLILGLKCSKLGNIMECDRIVFLGTLHSHLSCNLVLCARGTLFVT